MHLLSWIAGLIGCGLLWIVLELLGDMIGEAIWLLLKWMLSPVLSPVFSPLFRAVRGLLRGSHGVAWRRAFLLAGLAGLGGGLVLLFDGAGKAAAGETIVGIAVAVISFGALLSLDARGFAPPA
jgi:hypothetical protein